MKDKRIVATDSPVTTVIVAGRPHHYFHSEALGRCRAILITEDENLEAFAKPYATKPLSTDERLEALMDCGERLHERFVSYFDALHSIPHTDFKRRTAAILKIKNIQKANRRLNRKIVWLIAHEQDS